MLRRICVRSIPSRRHVSSLAFRRATRPPHPSKKSLDPLCLQTTSIYVAGNLRQYTRRAAPKSPKDEVDVGADVEINIETNLDHPLPLPYSPRAGITTGTQDAVVSDGGAVSLSLLHNVPLPSATAQHRDLKSFLDHAKRMGLSKTSTTYRGTHYEYMVQTTLRRYGFELVRVGGRGDGGVDMVGVWRLPAPNGAKKSATAEDIVPSEENRKSPLSGGTRSDDEALIRVLVQCKRLAGKSGKLAPNLMRELEGAMRGGNVPAGWRGNAVMGLLVNTRPATKGIRDAMAGCRRAVGWVCLEVEEQDEESSSSDGQSQEEESTGIVRQMLWNKAANDIGLVGFDAVARYGASGLKSGEAGLAAVEVVLMRKDRIVPSLDQPTLVT